MLTDGLQSWGESVLDELGADVSFTLKNPLIDEYLDAWREQKIDGITRTTRDQVTALLQNASADGVGISEMKRRLREAFEGWTSTKAATVARTEVVGASNAANLAAYQISGLVEGKEWLAVQDENTRETHAEMDGQQRAITADFVSPSGNHTQGPGLFGVAAEDINCRCTVIPKVSMKALLAQAMIKDATRGERWKKYDASLRPWEKDIEDAMAKVIGAWLGDVIAALD